MNVNLESTRSRGDLMKELLSKLDEVNKRIKKNEDLISILNNKDSNNLKIDENLKIRSVRENKSYATSVLQLETDSEVNEILYIYHLIFLRRRQMLKAEEEKLILQIQQV